MSIARNSIVETPIQYLGGVLGNRLFVKREDLIPFSFGGNKARKAFLFFNEIDYGGYDIVVTYGSSSSNHCRVIANMAAARRLPCLIICPAEASEPTFNSKLIAMAGAQIVCVSVSEVHDTIENELEKLCVSGHRPYFIMGGGHGNIGTQAYVNCHEEICHWENESNVHFDFIFHASGTGTTQAGLVCGQLLNKEQRHTIGISIARKLPCGRQVVIESVHQYLESMYADISDTEIEKATTFIDDYTGDGYGKLNLQIMHVIQQVMLQYGLPLDSTYTGKAFAGMQDYIRQNNIQDRNILFIHTGGTPLFFDSIDKLTFNQGKSI